MKFLFRFRLLLQSVACLAAGRVRCPCGWTGRQFAPLHEGHAAIIRCPACLSVDRQRLYRLYLEEMQPRIGACLHVSPETIVMRFLEKHAAPYLSIDLDPAHVMQREDLTGLSFADASFDFIFCAHVLEHIPDDRRAMRELHRVLKPGGMAILQVPLTQHAYTYEDPSITDPVARRKAFGQEDHVRKYGQDYPSRLAEAGFTVRVERYFDSLPRIVRNAFVLRSEDLYLCTK